MAVVYLDTSALIKRYVSELGSAWITSVAFDAPSTTLITSRLTIAEVRSALARRRREMNIDAQTHVDAVAAFIEDCANRYGFVELDSPVLELAGELLDRHPLRANDAVQLASAMLIDRALQDAGISPLTFLCVDERLISVAKVEGLSTDNPNQHP